MIDLKALLQLRWFAVWIRHAKVLHKLFFPTLLGNFGEPLLILIALGYGLGYFVGEVNDVPYLAFLASGMVCSSAMQTATFETQYSGYTRMNVQLTWQGMLATPLDLQDVVFGEVVWAATKSVFSVTAILMVATILGAIDGGYSILSLPILFFASLCFASMAMIMTALAKNYDFFLYYQTLLVTPAIFLSGVFFPLEQMPMLVQQVIWLLPLVHVIELVRPLLINTPFPAWPTALLHITVILFYFLLCLNIALWLLHRRLFR